jgi:hypothetical protein
MIVCGILLCDLKRSSWSVALPAALRLEGDITYCINIETVHPDDWGGLFGLIKASGRPFQFDIWQRWSSWGVRESRDQDTSRLEPICVARNMVRAYAVASGASHMLTIDADVIVRPDGLQRLLALNRLICGGYVPGRGAHNAAWYAFGVRWQRGNIMNCAHGTAGFMLTAREAFATVAWRWGFNQDDIGGGYQAEDPLWCNDIVHVFGERGEMWIDTNVTAEHVDNPERPLVLSEAVNDYIT